MAKFFKLHSTCQLVKGKKRSLLCDFGRGGLEFFPVEMYDLISSLKKSSIEGIMKGKENSYIKIVNEYLDYMVEKEYGFYLSKQEMQSFPDIDNSYHSPHTITNTIIEVGSDGLPSKKIINKIEGIGCANISILSYVVISNKKLTEFLELFKDTAFTSIEIIIPYRKEYTVEFFEKLSRRFFRVTRIMVYNAGYNESHSTSENLLFEVIFFQKNITSFKRCGMVDVKYFSSTFEHFTESLHHNSCLNRKISIDVDGNIKNCPSMPESYGNIKDTTLEEALDKPGFKKYWNVTKDMVEVCKDCEFRYICTDCRAYTERTKFDKEDIDLSKPLKCGYNPYTNEWAEWSTNPLKQKAIEYYGMQDLVKKDA